MIKHNTMQKSIRLVVVLLLVAYSLSAQSGKHISSSKSTTPPAPERLLLHPNARQSVPVTENLFGFSNAAYKPLAGLNLSTPSTIEISRDGSGAPIFYRGHLENAAKVTDPASAATAAMEYIAGIQPEGVENTTSEFVVNNVQSDEQGNYHVRMTQVWKNIPLYSTEVIAHSKNGVFEMFNGRFEVSPAIDNVTTSINSIQAIDLVKANIGRDKIKSDWSAMDLKIIGTDEPFHTELVIYHLDNKPFLAWHIIAHPNLMRRVIYFVDARTGTILNKYDHTCAITHVGGEDEVVDGPVTANGTDLLGVNRSFGAWKIGSTHYLEDGSQSMFNSSSQMPGEPIGAIVTLDAKNTSPENSSSFDYDYTTSNSLTFSNTSAVSSHWNSTKSYLYYKDKFGRNSIDGNGGNIISFFNVADGDGSSMENAFWNGAAMWYGNGGSTFKKLARGLDVGGHEMTHGVVEKTANLEYQGESGALNESFADIFGAMIDPGDWQIGEDVMQPGTHTCLRDLSNPNNGVSTSSPFWQPGHVNQQYNGTQDNGGVHINSGIVNKAYYLFATAAGVGTAKAEQVYYRALRDYLVKSSKFIDCRLAIIQSASDLYGSAVANAAAAAFTQVGIAGSTPSGNYLGQLAVNPGTSYIMCVADDYSSFDLADAAGTVLGTVYSSDAIKSRPSISDDGSTAVLVNETGHIILFDFTYGTQISFQSTQISADPEWRSAAISKDGRFLAAITDFKDNNIYVFDLLTNSNEVFQLYNPTYSQGQSTGDVQYADVMEFDYSGEHIMYDAFNKITNSQNQVIEYWDIGFLEFRKNGTYTDGANAPIAKLVNGLPENTDIGDPAFAKNSPYVIAFDYYDQTNNLNSIIGANLETGDNYTIISNIGDFGWPNYDREDKNIILHRPSAFGYDIYKQGVNSTKIQAQGGATKIINSHIWGVWYAAGLRGLAVDAGEATRSDAFRISASPNPTSGSVRIQFNMPEQADITVGIYQLTGALITERTMTATTGENYFDADLGDQPAGVYFIRLQSGNGLSIVKIVKK
jgi:Zn-dependent metalloprotease